VSAASLVGSGPLLLAIPVAAAAGAVTFLSPCCLPLVPGYLAYITGMSGADASADGAAVAVADSGADLSAAGSGGGVLLQTHADGITQILGGVTILLGLLFFGAFDRFMFAGRIFKPSFRPRAGLAGAPVLGVMFGIGWTPCIGPTLGVVMALSLQSGTAARGAFLCFVYGLGLGIPFLVVAAIFQRMVGVLGFFKRNARMVSRIGGVLLVVVGLLEVSGAWTAAIDWLKQHWFNTYTPPL